MLPTDDAFVLAVARHGTGPWVRCARVSVRWLAGRSLGPLRRTSGCRKLRSKSARAAALRSAFASVDTVALLQLALQPYANCVAEFQTGAPPGEPPCAFTRGARRWDLHALGVPRCARVAWCVETAASGGVPPASCPRAAFTHRMLALMPPRANAASMGPQLPDAAAWYDPPCCAAVAMRRCASSSRWLVFFGALLGQHTMHIQEEVAVASPGALAEAVASLCGTMRLPFRCPTPQWVPSLLGARLERVRLVRTARSLADDEGVTPALRIADAAALFRDASLAAQAQRWLLRAHEARAIDARGGGARAPHRVRLALECVVGSASVLWAMSLPMGAAYTGAGGAHVLSFPRATPLVVRPSRGGGWTAAPRLTLGMAGAAVTPLASGATSATVLEAALRGMLALPGACIAGGGIPI